MAYFVADAHFIHEPNLLVMEHLPDVQNENVVFINVVWKRMDIGFVMNAEPFHVVVSNVLPKRG